MKRSSVKEDRSEDSSCNNENDSGDLDTDDSDWECAPCRKQSLDAIDTPSSTRKTRMRCNKWKCQECTLINNEANKECVVCEAPKPGIIPELE